MKSFEAKHYLLEINLKREKVDSEASFGEFPFSLPVIRALNHVYLHPSVTFIVGENGSGKSTLLEALAIAAGFNPEGGSKSFNFATRASHTKLHNFIQLRRGIHREKDGFFLRAESFYNVATAVDNYLVTESYGGRSLHEQSHGESFFALIMNRFKGKGLYLLDEPEAALSPSRQMSMLTRMYDLVRDNSQFVIATHSPILMAYPDADILLITAEGLKKVNYTDTEHYRVTRDFLNNHERSLKILLSE
jgi:predicted ATPase